MAVAKDASGHVVARDEVDTAGAPYALKLTPDKTILRADGKSLSYVTVHVVDRHGVEVPDADNPVQIGVTGAGTFQGADNGKQDDAEGYKSTTHDAFNGKLLAIVQSGHAAGPDHRHDILGRPVRRTDDLVLERLAGARPARGRTSGAPAA